MDPSTIRIRILIAEDHEVVGTVSVVAAGCAAWDAAENRYSDRVWQPRPQAKSVSRSSADKPL